MLNDKGLKKLHTAMQGNEALGREVIQLLALTTHDHEDLRKLMATVPGAERRTAYETLKPHLSFKPKPLDEYLAMNANYAERHQLPSLDPDTGALKDFTPARSANLATLAEKALNSGGYATFTCSKCTQQEEFRALTMVSAAIAGIASGWQYDREKEVHICPKCADASQS